MIDYGHLSTTARGNAAVMLAAADIILSGNPCSLAYEGSAYDLVAEVGEQLLRVQVKSTMALKERPGRPNAPLGWRFGTCRNVRPCGAMERTRLRQYDDRDCDIIALVALPTREVAYMNLCGKLPATTWVYPNDAPLFAKAGHRRRRFCDLTIEAALAGWRGVVK